MALYTTIKLISGVAPKKYIDRHTIKLRKVATLDLNLEEKVQVLGLSFAGGCGLFFLGNYGVEGNFSNNDEEWYFGAVTITGGASLFVTSVWKGLVIRAEIKRNQETGRTGSKVMGTEKKENSTCITEISSVWISLGVIATTTHTTLCIMWKMIEQVGGHYYEPYMQSLLPLNVTLNIICLMAHPRRHSRSYMMLLRFHFTRFCWLSLGSLYFEEEMERKKFIYLGVSVSLILLFHYGLTLRASIGRLPDEDLSEFLFTTLFKGGFKTLAPILFIQFRSLNCVLESQSYGHC